MNAWLGDRSVVVTLRSVNVLVRFMIVLSMMVCVCGLGVKISVSISE